MGKSTEKRAAIEKLEKNDMFQTMVDLALEPRSVLEANSARYKNQKSHDLHNYLSKYDPFADLTS